MAVLVGYFDESHASEREAGAFSVAGFVSTAEHWEALTYEWALILCEYRIKEFKSADCASRLDAFEGWPTEKQIACVCALLSVLERSVLIGVFSTVLAKDFKEIVEPALAADSALRDPYLFCWQGCLAQVRNAAAPPQGEKIRFHIDDGDIARGKALELFYSFRHAQGLDDQWGGVTAESSKDFAPLQAADVLAYETYKRTDTLAYGPARRIRPSTERLRATKRLYGAWWDAKTLQAFVENRTEPGLM